VIRGQGQAVSRVAWFLVVPVSAPVTGGSLRAAGVPAAPLGGIAAGAVTGVALVAVWPAAFGERTRRQCCGDGRSPAALGVLVVPTAMAMRGTGSRADRQPSSQRPDARELGTRRRGPALSPFHVERS
jgi:hypothetical protein